MHAAGQRAPLLSLVLVLVLVSVTLAACPGIERRTLPQHMLEMEILLGKRIDRNAIRKHGIFPDSELSKYVTRVGRRLAAGTSRPKLPWTFRVTDRDELTAYALPGGYIHVTRGLLAYLNNEAELAALLCHEIGHVIDRHYLSNSWVYWAPSAQLTQRNRRIFTTKGHWFWLISLLSVQQQRYQHKADEYAVGCLKRGGYAPRALYHMLKLMQQIQAREELPSRSPRARAAMRPASPGPLPPSPKRVPTKHKATPRPKPRLVKAWPVRINLIRKLLGGSPALERPLPVDHVFLRHLAGLIVAPDPSAGVLVGKRYINIRDGFQLRVPAGWQVKVVRNRLNAHKPGKQAYLLVTSMNHKTPAMALQSFVGQGQSRRAQRVSLNGLKALGGQFDFGRSLRGKVFTFKAKEVVFLVALYCSKPEWSRRAASFSRVIASLGPVARPLPSLARPWRIRVQAAKTGTWAGCAVTPAALDAVRRLNRMAPGTTPKAGQLLKCLARGAGRR